MDKIKYDGEGSSESKIKIKIKSYEIMKRRCEMSEK